MGGGWPRETVLLHSGKPTPPRFARLPLPEEGARMIFKETLIQSLSFAVRLSRFPTYAMHFSAFLICLSYRRCPIRPCGAPAHRETLIQSQSQLLQEFLGIASS